MRRAKRHSQGFSLLEMIVAMSILALSLGVLYQAVSGATRNVRTDEKYAYGVELARSLLANYAVVPASGLSTRGETAGEFRWEVQASPFELPQPMQAGSLQAIAVTVSWPDRGGSKSVALHSVVQGVKQ
ncbi:MAG: general secretion pathway protein I [Halioglobus sp.]|jgi:general secretion pathway protein I